MRNCRSAASYIPRVSRTAPSIWRELWEVDWAFFRPPAATAATIGEPYQMRACLSLRQNNRAWQTLVVHARRDLAGAARDVRRVVAPADPALPNFGVSTLIESVESGFSTNRTAAALGGFFGVVALLVASIGLYAVVVDGVAERTREIGVRVALGAARGSVLQLLMRSGARLGIVGLAIGLAGAFAVARRMSGLLVGLSPSDPITFALVARARGGRGDGGAGDLVTGAAGGWDGSGAGVAGVGLAHRPRNPVGGCSGAKTAARRQC